MAKQASVEYGVLQAAIEFFNRHVFSHDPSLAEPFSHVDTLKLSELPPGATISLFKQNPASPEDEPCLLVGTPGGALLEVPSPRDLHQQLLAQQQPLRVRQVAQ